MSTYIESFHSFLVANEWLSGDGLLIKLLLRIKRSGEVFVTGVSHSRARSTSNPTLGIRC